MRPRNLDPIAAGVLHAAIHSLKGPANRLRVLSGLVKQDSPGLDESSRRLLSHIEDSAGEVAAVADGLRRYAEVCSRPLRPECMDLDAALAAALAGMRGQIDSACAEVERSGLPVVEADPFLMTWLFQELISNALRFGGGRDADSAPSAAVRIWVAAGAGGPGGWFVSVADNGPGIDACAVENVFKPFRKQGGGAGLGLTVCRWIVEAHGGRIWAEAKSGGADFRFFLGGAERNGGRP